jgi:hypothetical protein
MGKSRKEAAFVLPKGTTPSTDAQTFPEFPGVFTPGEPVRVAGLGFESVADAHARADELGLPLKRTTHTFPPDDGVAESALEAAETGEKAPSEPADSRPAEETPVAALNEEELAARHAEEDES